MGLTAGFAAMAVTTVVNSKVQSDQTKIQSDYTKSIYGINQQLAGEQKKQAVAAGDIEAGEMMKQGRQQAAEQRVKQAATGADVNSGSALGLQSDTKWQAAQNSVMIKNNAWRQAWGYQLESDKYGYEADLEELAAKNKSNLTMLTGGMQAADYGMKGYSAYMKYNG